MPDETRFSLCAGVPGFRLKHAEVEFVLSGEGIAYALEGRSGLRLFSNLRSVRLQAVNPGPNNPWEASVELTFGSGLPLIVLSAGPWGGDEPHRDAAFIAFVEDLHRRLVAGGHGDVRYLRGIPEGRYRFLLGVVVIAAVMFGGAGLMVLGLVLSGKAGFLEAAGPLAGLFGFGLWIGHSVQRSKPGTYDPRHLPREVFPE